MLRALYYSQAANSYESYVVWKDTSSTSIACTYLAVDSIEAWRTGAATLGEARSAVLTRVRVTIEICAQSQSTSHSHAHSHRAQVILMHTATEHKSFSCANNAYENSFI